MSKMDILEKELIRYQKAALFLLYPSIISFFGVVMGSFSNSYGYYLTLASSRFTTLYFRNNPVAGNQVLSLSIACVISLLIAFLFVFLTLKATKAKLYALVIATSLYLIDSVYGALEIIPSVGIYPMTGLEYGINLALHVAFLALYVYLFYRYAKLLRLEKELKAN